MPSSHPIRDTLKLEKFKGEVTQLRPVTSKRGTNHSHEVAVLPLFSRLSLTTSARTSELEGITPLTPPQITRNH